MAELIGAILGDGNIYDRRPNYVEMCGNPITDIDYYEGTLLPIIDREVGRQPKLFIRDGGLRFRINCKPFVDWLKERGIPTCDAKGQATIPDFIAKDPALLPRCVRGVYDTDGSVYFDMRRAYTRPYPRIDLHMTNAQLLKQLDALLSDLRISHCFAKAKGSIITSGELSLKDFLQRVGFSNPHHIRRIWMRYPELVRYNRSVSDCVRKVRRIKAGDGL